jgi:hypothetical protein
MKKFIVPAGICAFVFMAACSKNNSGSGSVPTNPVDSIPPTAVDLMVAHTWKIDTIGLDADKNGSIDTPVPGGFKPCDLDNTLTFKSDSTGIFDEGTLKCVDTTAQTVPFTWYLSHSDSLVTITGAIPGQLHGDINVLTRTDSTLVLSKPVPFTSNSTVNLIVALKK